MLGELTLGHYVAYGAISLFLLVLVVMFLRLVLMLSLLLIAPTTAILRRIPGLGRLGRAAEQPASEASASD